MQHCPEVSALLQEKSHTKTPHKGHFLGQEQMKYGACFANLC